MDKLDREKALVIQIFFTMGMQLILTGVGIVAFFMVLFRLFDAKTVFDSSKYIAIEGLLGGSIFLAYKFFFPSPVAIKEAAPATEVANK